MKRKSLVCFLALACLFISKANYAQEGVRPEAHLSKEEGSRLEMKADPNPELAEIENSASRPRGYRFKIYKPIEKKEELPPRMAKGFKLNENRLWNHSAEPGAVFRIEAVEHYGLEYYYVEELRPRAGSQGESDLVSRRIYDYDGRLVSQAESGAKVVWNRTAAASPKTFSERLGDALRAVKKYSGPAKGLGVLLGGVGLAELLTHVSDARTKASTSASLDAEVGPARERSTPDPTTAAVAR